MFSNYVCTHCLPYFHVLMTRLLWLLRCKLNQGCSCMVFVSVTVTHIRGLEEYSCHIGLIQYESIFFRFVLFCFAFCCHSTCKILSFNGCSSSRIMNWMKHEQYGLDIGHGHSTPSVDTHTHGPTATHSFRKRKWNNNRQWQQQRANNNWQGNCQHNIF